MCGICKLNRANYTYYDIANVHISRNSEGGISGIALPEYINLKGGKRDG